MTKEELLNIYLNTMKYNKFIPNHRLTSLYYRINNLKAGKKFNLKEIDDILHKDNLCNISNQKLFIIKNKDNKLIFDKVQPLLVTLSHKLEHNYDLLNKKIEHPIYPLAFNNKDGYILCAVFTTTDKHYDELTVGLKFGDVIADNKINNYKINYKIKNNKKLIEDLPLDKDNNYTRGYITWLNGANGNDKLINLGLTSLGKNQYTSRTLIYLTQDQLFNLMELNKIEKPLLAHINELQRILLEDSYNSVQIIDLITKKFSIISKSELTWYDLPRTYHNYDLSKSYDFKQFFYIKESIEAAPQKKVLSEADVVKLLPSSSNPFNE